MVKIYLKYWIKPRCLIIQAQSNCSAHRLSSNNIIFIFEIIQLILIFIPMWVLWILYKSELFYQKFVFSLNWYQFPLKLKFILDLNLYLDIRSDWSHPFPLPLPLPLHQLIWSGWIDSQGIRPFHFFFFELK